MRPARTRTCEPFLPLAFSHSVQPAEHRRRALLCSRAARRSLKWKPPSENSIDFKLVLRFAPTPGKPKAPDFQTKPVFELHGWGGDDRGVPRYEFYDVMHVDDDEWER